MDPKNIPKAGSDLEPEGWWFFPLLIEELFRASESSKSQGKWQVPDHNGIENFNPIQP